MILPLATHAVSCRPSLFEVGFDFAFEDGSGNAKGAERLLKPPQLAAELGVDANGDGIVTRAHTGFHAFEHALHRAGTANH
jgi:hypothetical protein